MTSPSLSSFAHTMEVPVRGEFYLQLPTGEAERAFPLLLFLHGMNDADSIFELPAPPRLVDDLQLPVAIASPLCRGLRWDIDELLGLLEHLERDLDIDQNRIYVTGISIGGLATWELALRRPHKFAAIVPICGAGQPWNAFRISHIPTWVFHGAKDEIVPVGESKMMVDALNRSGGTAKLTVYPDEAHGAWGRAYNEPDLWSWLLAREIEGQPK